MWKYVSFLVTITVENDDRGCTMMMDSHIFGNCKLQLLQKMAIEKVVPVAENSLMLSIVYDRGLQSFS